MFFDATTIVNGQNMATACLAFLGRFFSVNIAIKIWQLLVWRELNPIMQRSFTRDTSAWAPPTNNRQHQPVIELINYLIRERLLLIGKICLNLSILACDQQFWRSGHVMRGGSMTARNIFDLRYTCMYESFSDVGVEYGLPAKIWRLVGCTEMLSW